MTAPASHAMKRKRTTSVVAAAAAQLDSDCEERKEGNAATTDASDVSNARDVNGFASDDEDDEEDANIEAHDDSNPDHSSGSVRQRRGGGSGARRHALSCRHPRGVKPLGNQLFEKAPPIRAAGFGRLGRVFTDAQLLDLLRTHLLAPDLVVLQQASRAMYILANEEELWRECTLSRYEGTFRFRKDWKNTYAFMRRRERCAEAGGSAPDVEAVPFVPLPTPLQFDGFYSDEIFQSFYCAHIDLQSSFGTTPAQDNIPRIHISEMTPERFRNEFGIPNRPVIITGMMDDWLCYGPAAKHDATRWTRENWLAKYGAHPFKIGRFTMPLAAYFEYMDAIASDESPLYLFDSKFGEKHPELLDQYEVAPFFARDFFDLLNDDPKVRPNFRWILVGPERSGSTFHKDPNHTSAWNGLISGQKKWIMYPIESCPPGIFPSENGAEVATPISVAEWFINNYDEHRRRVEEYEWKLQRSMKEAAASSATETDQSTVGPPASKKAKHAGSSAAGASSVASCPSSSSSSTLVHANGWFGGPVEATCQPGELIWIPNGWWHTALNLTPSFAVTQNYVNEENLWNVIDFLATDEGERERNLTLLDALETKLREVHPELAEAMEAKKVAKEIARAEREEEEARAANKKVSSLWSSLTDSGTETKPFSFAAMFGSSSSDDAEPMEEKEEASS